MSARRADCRRLSTSVVAASVATTLLLPGCRDEQSRARPGLDQSDVPADAAADVRTLLVDWVIRPDPDGVEALAAPMEIEVHERLGRLYVLETQPPELRVYDSSGGALVAVVGRSGDGPGEFRFPISLAVSAEGTAAVLSTRGRVSFWNEALDLTGTVVVPAGLATDVVASGADRFYVKTDLFPPLDVSRFFVVTPDSAQRSPTFEDGDLADAVGPESAVRNHNYAVAATASGTLLLGLPGPEYAILQIDRTGQRLPAIRRRDVMPIVRGSPEVKALVGRIRRGIARAGGTPPATLEVPRYRSHVARLAVGPDGSIWALTGRGGEGRSVIDEFSADGAFVGSHRVDLQISDLAVTSRNLYLLVRDTLDLPGVAHAVRPERRETDSDARDE